MTQKDKWQRARTNEQKMQRINALTEAADALFEFMRYDEITIAAIAKRAGFTRSNTYKYFHSKEELFLEMLKHDFASWTEEVLCTLRPGERYSPDNFTMIWTGLLLKHFRLIRLFSVLFSRIEKNLSEESLLDFKHFLLGASGDVERVILSIYPELQPDDVSEFFNLNIASAIGLLQMTDHTETQRMVMSNEAFVRLRIDFGESSRKTARYLLEGLLRERSK